MKQNYLILFNTKNRGTIEAIGTIIDPILFDRTNGENWNQLIRKLAMIRRKSTPSILRSSIRTWNVRRIQPNKLDEMNKKLIFNTFWLCFLHHDYKDLFDTFHRRSPCLKLLFSHHYVLTLHIPEFRMWHLCTYLLMKFLPPPNCVNNHEPLTKIFA